jgi:hypothetical protein
MAVAIESIALSADGIPSALWLSDLEQFYSREYDPSALIPTPHK